MNGSRVNLRAVVVSAMMAALALVLPMAFHLVGLGSSFLPMLLPLLLNGFLVPVGWAAFVGGLVPLLSALLTGMPPLYPPIALVMCAEGAVTGATASAVFRLTRPRTAWPLLTAVVAGRAVMLVLTWALAGQFGLPGAFSATASLAHGIPGVVLQCTVVPLALRAIRRHPSLLTSHEPAADAEVL